MPVKKKTCWKWKLNSPKQAVTIDVMVLFFTTVRGVWISQYFCQRISLVLIGILFYAGHPDFSLHLFLTWVLPSQSLWISVSSGPTVKLLAFFISSFCSLYASDFLTSPASPWPSIASKARPAGFGCFPSRALRGSSSHSVPPCPSVPLRAESRGCRGLARRTPDGLGMRYVVSRGQGLRGPASAVNHDSKRW